MIAGSDDEASDGSDGERKRVGEEKSVNQRWDICLLPQVLGGRTDRSGITNPTWMELCVHPAYIPFLAKLQSEQAVG